MSKLTLHHIPVCPFSQRLEILLSLKGMRDRVRFEVVDVTVPRPQTLLAKTDGSTVLPVLETETGEILHESLVILNYLDALWPEPQIARNDPLESAVERMLIARESGFTNTGYGMILNRDPSRRDEFKTRMDQHYLDMSRFLERRARGDVYLFEQFGLAEAVFTPLFMRFWFLEHYDDYDLPTGPEFDRVRLWRDACLDHPATQQVSRREIVTLYYDYAQGIGNGGLLPGRSRSSFALSPSWRDRPLPPRDKFGPPADDVALGLL